MLTSLISFLQEPRSRAVGVVFATSSMLFGAWVTRLPELKDRLELSEGELGIALFFIPLGSVSLLPFYTPIIHYLGDRKATLLGTYGVLTTILLPTLAADYEFLVFTLFLLGLSEGLMNVAMNGVAVEVEKRTGKAIMSTCHGCFSLGGMFGAGIGSFFVGLQINPFIHLSLVAVLMLLLVLWSKKHLLSAQASEEGGTKWAWPPVKILGIVFVGFSIMLGEGAIADWSAIYLQDVVLANAYVVGLGYAAFSLAMAIGRFSGDKLTEQYGGKAIVRTGILLSILGLGLVLWASTLSTMLGFFLVGLGYSCVVPILFSLSARVPGVRPSNGIAAVASSGYVGFLVGPVVIGLMAEELGLKAGFVGLILLTAAALVVNTWALPKS